MKLSLQEAVLLTISYSDIFDYPLTLTEIHRGLIGKSSTVGQVQQGIGQLYKKKIIEKLPQKDGEPYYVLKSRRKIVLLRKRRESVAGKKLAIMRRVAQFLSFVPTISLISVTGGLSMHNADKRDDIDVCIFCEKGTIWITRVLASVVVDLVATRRRAGQRELPNAICLNMFMTDTMLRVMNSEQDLYSAHEVVQLLPIWQRRSIWQKFLVANLWVKHFMPNAFEEKLTQSATFSSHPGYGFPLLEIVWVFMSNIVKYPQLWYMKGHRTREYITDTVIRFHPVDARDWVKQALQKRLTTYHIPLDKVFNKQLK